GGRREGVAAEQRPEFQGFEVYPGPGRGLPGSPGTQALLPETDQRNGSHVVTPPTSDAVWAGSPRTVGWISPAAATKQSRRCRQGPSVAGGTQAPTALPTPGEPNSCDQTAEI